MSPINLFLVSQQLPLLSPYELPNTQHQMIQNLIILSLYICYQIFSALNNYLVILVIYSLIIYYALRIIHHQYSTWIIR